MHYPYTSLVLTLLGKNGSWRSSGQLVGFYQDTATHMDDYAGANVGFVSRRTLITAAAVGNTPTIVEVVMRPYIGACQHNRLILDRTAIRLELLRSKDSFTLIHNDVAGAAIKINSAQWHLRRVRLSDNTHARIDAALVQNRALYPINRIRIFSDSDSFKSQEIDFTGVLAGAMPTHVVIGFVSTAAVQGSNKQNPFNFANFGLTRLQVTAAGINYPRTELAPIFVGDKLAGSQVGREYHRLLEMTHKINTPEGLLISMSDYVGGCALYAFDLTPDLASGHWSPSVRGSLEIHGAFNAIPAAHVSIIVLAEVPGVWELNADRSVIKDW